MSYMSIASTLDDVPSTVGIKAADPAAADKQETMFMDVMSEWVECERALLTEFSDDDDGKIFSDDSEVCDEAELSSFISSAKSFKSVLREPDASVFIRSFDDTHVIAPTTMEKPDQEVQVANNNIEAGSYLAADRSDKIRCSSIMATSSSKSRSKVAIRGNFVSKLAAALSSPDSTDILHWLPNGTSFRIADPKGVEEKVLSKYFKLCKYSSFIRQLNMWGFMRTARGPYTGSYFHKFFLRDKPELLSNMKLQNSQAKFNGASNKKNPLPPNRRVIANVVPGDTVQLNVPCHTMLNTFTVSPGSSVSPPVSVVSSEYNNEIDIEPIMVDFSSSACVPTQDFNPHISTNSYSTQSTPFPFIPTPRCNNNVPSATLQDMLYKTSQAQQAATVTNKNSKNINLGNKLSFGLAMQNGAVFSDLTVPKPTGARYSTYGYGGAASTVNAQTQGMLYPSRSINNPSLSNNTQNYVPHSGPYLR